MTVNDKTSEGKIHLGAVLTAMMDGENCALPEVGAVHEFKPVFTMMQHMTGQECVRLFTGIPMCKKYFCKEHPGFDDVVGKVNGEVKKAIKKLEEESGGKAPGFLWREYAIKLTGVIFFHIPKEVEFSDDAYYLKVPKNCLKEEFKQKAVCKSLDEFFNFVNSQKNLLKHQEDK